MKITDISETDIQLVDMPECIRGRPAQASFPGRSADRLTQTAGCVPSDFSLLFWLFIKKIRYLYAVFE
jgi:hypothetical protein